MNKHLKEMIKFALVGLMNTLLSLALIYIFMNLLKFDYRLSNVLGYIAGLINSFFWNRNWTFKSKGNPFIQALIFLGVFLFCYACQFLALLLMVEKLFWSTNLSQPAAMVLYTGINYGLNKFITFRKKEKN